MRSQLLARTKMIMGILFFVGSLGVFCTSAFAYSIDGLLNDWGISLASNNKGYLNGKTPSSSTAYYIPEDNADVHSGFQFIGPGYSYYNLFDAEAMMFDNDNSNLYIAIVTGLPKTGADAPGNPHFNPGDIFIDINSDGNYDFGINYEDGKLYQYTGFQSVYYDGVHHNPDYSAAGPYRINGTLVNAATQFIYTTNPVNSHYVMEALIPLSAMNVPSSQKVPATIHWTMGCGNDVLNLKGNIATTPEPASMALLGLGLLGMARRFRKR